MTHPRQLAVFYRSLSQLLAAGIPVTRALESCGHPEISQHIQAGSTLSEALGHLGAFPAQDVSLLTVAEKSGRTDAVLLQLADYTDQLIAMRRTILTGCLLPALILHAAAFIIPLPAFLLGGTLTGYVAASFGFIAGVWLLLFISILTFRFLPPAIFQRIPIIGSTWRDLDLWRIATGMEMLTNAGLGVIESLRTVAGTCHSPRIAAALRNTADAAEFKGEPASQALAATREFPSEMIALWSTGEQSGRLDEMLKHLAVLTADRCQRRMQEVGRWAPRIVYAAVSAYLVFQILRMGAAYVNLLNSF